MNTSKRYVAIAAFAIAASVFGSAAAIAADSDGHTLFRRVSYKDLDLNSESGVGTLYKRIKSAAETVCAPYIGRELVQYMNQVACVTSSFERAVKQVNQPMLTRYYLARHPKSDLGTSLTATR